MGYPVGNNTKTGSNRTFMELKLTSGGVGTETPSF